MNVRLFPNFAPMLRTMAAAAVAASCSSSGSNAPSAEVDAGSTLDASASSKGATTTLTASARTFTLYTPSAASAGNALPLVVFMHHFQGEAADGESDFALQTLAESRGFLYAAPSGASRRWNATDACCDTSQSVDDAGYLAAVVAVTKANANVDAKRVFFFGHSNGGFMAHRMACDHADVIAAVASISGAMWNDASHCKPSGAVSVLEVHATEDPVIAYGGGTFMGGVYPAATTTVSDWATFDACASTPTAGSTITLSGSTTTVSSYSGCSSSAAVTLWSIDSANHLPMTGAESTGHVLDWLFAHPKP